MIERLENIGIVVEDLEAAIEFFVGLGMELEGQAPVEGPEVDRINGLEGVRADIAMVRAPDGGAAVELMKFHHPVAVSAESNAPVNALGIRRILFGVKDIKTMAADLQARGMELMGEVVPFADSYLFCYVRGPEGIIVALCEKLD